MKFYFLLLLLLPFSIPKAAAQTDGNNTDTVWSIDLPNQDVKANRVWHNDTARYHYNQMRYYVKTVMPYVNEGTRIFTDINRKLAEPGLSHKERKRYIASREKEIKTNFEDKIKKLNTTQGMLLVKLMARQTSMNLYHVLQEVKGNVGAMEYQVWAKLNGFNLNRDYHPEEEPDLEHIMLGLGYPLPASYSMNNANK